MLALVVSTMSCGDVDPGAGADGSGSAGDGTNELSTGEGADEGVDETGADPSSDPTRACEGRDHWRLLESPPQPAVQSSVITLPDGTILVAGGLVRTAQPGYLAVASAARFDPATDTWLPLPELPHSRALHQILPLDDGDVLLVGGSGGEPRAQLATSVRFDPDTEQWTPGPSLPDAVGLITSIAHGDLRVVMGQTRAFALEGAGWRELAPPPASVVDDGLIGWGDDLLMIRRGQNPAMIYDPIADAWTEGPREIDEHEQWGTPIGDFVLAVALVEPDVVFILGKTYGIHHWVATQEVPATFSRGADRWIGGGQSPPLSHTVARGLGDGRVLVMAGERAAIYLPERDRWCWTSEAPTQVQGTPVVLDDGSVFFPGGSAPDEPPYRWFPQ